MGLPVPRQGHCGGTDEGEEGDCDKGDKGMLPYGPSAPEVFGVHLKDELACVSFCRDRCARCRFVSISAKGKDCSWYAACDVDHLQMEPRWLGHKTYDVQKPLAQKRALVGGPGGG